MKKFKLPKGFLASGIHSGVKKKRKDLSLFYSEVPAKVAAIFTTNKVKAAPVVLGKKTLEKADYIKAIVVNSGNANCMTGKRGLKDVRAMVKRTAEVLSIKKEEVLVSSTGIIGEFMSMKPILKGLAVVAKRLSRTGIQDAAEGIMTTDKFSKISSREIKLAGRKITILGVAKGAGMIRPDMATMLGYVLTDANIQKKALKKALVEAADVSFNAMTVDGDMSTNDTLAILANGLADNKLIQEKDKSFKVFKKNLAMVCQDLAKMIVTDGEGASKFINIKVTGAHSNVDAKKIAGSIANSVLVKCAVLGGDPNWGRIASSAGASGAAFDPDKMEIVLDGVTFFKSGKVAKYKDRKKSPVFKEKNVLIEVNLHSGKGEAVAFSCDISKKYITLNSYYTT